MADKDTNLKHAADTAVQRARAAMAQERLGEVFVKTAIWYGAVDINPKYLVVWILLAGADDDELPKWASPESATDSGMDPHVTQWMNRLRRIVRAEFETASWPDAASITVMFDSEHRVAEGGGFWYFK